MPGPEREIGNEMAVHHVHMNPVDSGLLGLRHLLTEASEIGIEDRGCQVDRAMGVYELRFCVLHGETLLLPSGTLLDAAPLINEDGRGHAEKQPRSHDTGNGP